MRAPLPPPSRNPRSLPATPRLATLLILLLGALLPTGRSTRAAVVINEVMYHPPDDRDEYQWVELWNPGATSVDLAGWSFRKGLKFTFTNSTPIAAGGFLVVSRDAVAFRLHYGTQIPLIGDFTGRLSHGGEQIELADREGRIMDRVRYDDAEPWPTSPDGLSSSLERLLASGPGDDPRNWEPSPLPPLRRPSGTPGAPNANARTQAPPDISAVEFPTPVPGQPIRVSARVTDPDGLREVRLAYRVIPLNGPRRTHASPGPGAAAVAAEPEIELPMVPAGELHTATLPATPDGNLVRFRIRAVDTTGSSRIAPHPNDARPTWSAYVGRLPGDSRIAQVALWQFGPTESAGPNVRSEFQPGPRRRSSVRATPARGESVLLHQAPDAAVPTVFDHIRIGPRQGGWKVRVHKDRPLDQMSTVNVIFESQPRFVLSEHLAYEMFRAAGHPAPLSGHWRITHNGRALGYHLFVEQPNSTYLRRIERDDAGDLYKILWYGRDLIAQHEKKNNPESGHAILVDTVNALGSATGAAQWRIIQDRFNVESCANYYAVSHCIQNWDGFFNNHFVYRSPGAAGKWEILPWDEDKTWGDHDGASPKYDWYSMPLTYGSATDKAPRAFLGGGPHGGPSWWRHGGWFSSPLLANPQFRTLFHARLRDLCENTFTPEAFEPAIAGLEHRLEPEVRHRASVLAGARVSRNPWTPEGEFQQTDPDAAANQFRRHIESFRNQLKHRREFLLRELAKAGVK